MLASGVRPGMVFSFGHSTFIVIEVRVWPTSDDYLCIRALCVTRGGGVQCVGYTTSFHNKDERYLVNAVRLA